VEAPASGGRALSGRRSVTGWSPVGGRLAQWNAPSVSGSQRYKPISTQHLETTTRMFTFFCALISVVYVQRLVCLRFILIAVASDSCRCPGCVRLSVALRACVEFLPRDAMHKRGLCRHAVSVCVSVTFVDCFKTNKHIFKSFSPSGSHTILVFPCQTA